MNMLMKRPLYPLNVSLHPRSFSLSLSHSLNFSVGCNRVVLESSSIAKSLLKSYQWIVFISSIKAFKLPKKIRN